jgi:hypothetical protein
MLRYPFSAALTGEQVTPAAGITPRSVADRGLTWELNNDSVL